MIFHKIVLIILDIKISKYGKITSQESVLLAGNHVSYLDIVILGCMAPLSFIAMIAPIGLVLVLASRIHKMKASTAQTMFWILAACYGIFFSNIFLQYTGESVFRVFFVSSSAFLGASLYGYVTKKSLARLGSFLFMGLIGIVMAMIVNIFLGSTGMQFIICILGVLIFTGLTAYDTQTLKEMYVAGESGETQYDPRYCYKEECNISKPIYNHQANP